jgi:hypothetical protein
MKKALITAFVIIGVGATIYFCGQRYEHYLQNEQERAIIAALMAVSGMPDFRKPSTSPPPPQ